MVHFKNKQICSVLICAVIGSSSLCANESENMVNTIMKLRGDVEKLYTEISDNKEIYKSELKSLSMQKADLETQINRQETALKQANLEITNTEKKIQELSVKNEDITPLLINAVDTLKSAIKVGIPFKIEDRIAELDKTKEQLKNRQLTPQRALAQVWSAYEDAIRLTKENGIFKQSINVNGKEKLCEIAKIGSVMMFFKTPDESVGYVKKENDAYTNVVVHNEKEKKEINTLFDALHKQIRTGYFQLPNALVLMESK